MTMMDIYMSSLPEGAEVENVVHKRGKYEFDLKYRGKTRRASVQDSWSPDKAGEYCKVIIKNAILMMYLETGDMEGAAQVNAELTQQMGVEG